MNYRLFIDDIRTPPEGGWNVARSSASAIELMQHNGCPQQISFDHDLGGDDTAMIIVRWMIDQDLDRPGFLPPDFRYLVHSANPVGRDNLNGLMDGYLKARTVA